MARNACPAAPRELHKNSAAVLPYPTEKRRAASPGRGAARRLFHDAFLIRFIMKQNCFLMTS